MEKLMDSLVSPRWIEEEENDSDMVSIRPEDSPEDSDDTKSTEVVVMEARVVTRAYLSACKCLWNYVAITRKKTGDKK